MKILVTGSRNTWVEDEPIMIDAFKKYSAKATAIITGGCTGVDCFAEQWFSKRGIHCSVVKALWGVNGTAAGPIRNNFILNKFRPDIILAFPKGESRGTRGCIKLAEQKGILTKVFELDEL